jgi:hypothetical protein
MPCSLPVFPPHPPILPPGLKLCAAVTAINGAPPLNPSSTHSRPTALTHSFPAPHT